MLSQFFREGHGGVNGKAGIWWALLRLVFGLLVGNRCLEPVYGDSEVLACSLYLCSLFNQCIGSSLPGMLQCAGVHRPLTVQPSIISCLIVVRASPANSEFAGFPVVWVCNQLFISHYIREVQQETTQYI